MWYNFGASCLIPVRRRCVCVGGGGGWVAILVGGHFQNLDWFWEVIFR